MIEEEKSLNSQDRRRLMFKRQELWGKAALECRRIKAIYAWYAPVVSTVGVHGGQYLCILGSNRRAAYRVSALA